VLLDPEQIVTRSGATNQNCENNAGKIAAGKQYEWINGFPLMEEGRAPYSYCIASNSNRIIFDCFFSMCPKWAIEALLKT
jgi:hypothetical protein